MKAEKIIIVAMMVLIAIPSVFAQNFQGVATYKSHRKVDLKMDSTQVSSEMHERMMAMLKKQFEKTYNLSFNRNESLYKEEESLEPPQPQGMVMVVMTSGESDIMYKNMSEKRYTSQNESLGKLFLVQDALPEHEWVMGTETKNIGEYTCYKATMEREIEVMESGMSVNGDKELSDEVSKKTITITAWYTPDIPVSFGPDQYHGLPGLILEVNDETTTLICSKIVLNPDEVVTIDEPKKGKKISQAEYDKIMDKKMKEMRERYERPSRDGHNVEIRIGG